MIFYNIFIIENRIILKNALCYDLFCTIRFLHYTVFFSVSHRFFPASELLCDVTVAQI